MKGGASTTFGSLSTGKSSIFGGAAQPEGERFAGLSKSKPFGAPPKDQ